MIRPNAGRSPADWDADVWAAAESLLADAVGRSPPEQLALGDEFALAGMALGVLALGGPVRAYPLREAVDEVCLRTRDAKLRYFVRQAALATEGEQKGLTDLASALRNAGRGLALLADGKLPRYSAAGAHASLKAEMLGVSTMSPEDAFRELRGG